ncbi:lactonase family protein [Variovorax sp. AFSI2.2]|uniref:lactonase family protein n=1 Tax=Variovorax sp. AFSI2.2 TaxID=3384160 RepID=UPI003EBA946B
MYAYVGSRTTRMRNARGEGISVYRLDSHQRRLELIQVLGDLVNPSFLALNRAGDVLYAVHGDEHEVSSFRVNIADGELELLNRRTCGGKNPVHLALDPKGRFMVVSNHLSGTAAVLPILEDGSIGHFNQLIALPGEPGPHRVEQPFSKPHFNPFDPSGHFVVIPDKGLDRVFIFRFRNGRLEPTETPYVDARAGSGPRHVAFHGTKPFAYVVNELDSTVTTYLFDPKRGGLVPRQVLSTLPDTFTGNSRASEIAVDANDRLLYASNRGFDSIAVFSIDGESGHLAFIGAFPSQGRTPRYLALAPNGQTLFVLNEDSDSIVALEVSQFDGILSATGEVTSCGSPVCMVFSKTSHRRSSPAK